MILRFSLILSKTTIVSCTENPMIVSRAVTNNVSISNWKKLKTPRTIITSCTRAPNADSPNFHGLYCFGISLKAVAI